VLVADEVVVSHMGVLAVGSILAPRSQMGFSLGWHIILAQQVLGQHLEAVGQLFAAGYRVEAVDLVTVLPDGQRVAGPKKNSQDLGCSRQLLAGWCEFLH